MTQKLKRTLASLSALAMVFTTAAVLPNGAFDFGGGITASAEDSTIEETGTWLEVSCAENNYKTIDYTSSDGNTYTCYVYSSTEYSAVLISVRNWGFSDGDGAYGYDNQVADLASKGARMPKFAELKIKTDAGEQYKITKNFSCQEYGVVWFQGGEWTYQGGEKYDDSYYCAAFDLNRNPIATVSDSLTKTCTSPALSTVKGEDFTWQGDCEATLTYYDADKTELETAPTALGEYYVKVSVPATEVTEGETTTRYEASESDYIPFTIGHNTQYYHNQENHWKVCANCGKKDEESAHTFVDGICTGCGIYEDGIGAKLAGYSLNLSGSIGVDFYMELDESVIADGNAYMQFTLPNGDTPEIKVSAAETQAVGDKTYYVFSCYVAAKEMTDTITAQIITSNGESTLYKYTVKDYADYILDEANGYDDKTKKLVSAMLNYGDYAKAYFNGETLAATEEMDKVVDVILNDAHYDPSDEKVTSGTLPEGIEYQGMSLVLESDTIWRLYFKVDESVDTSLYNFDSNKGNYYYQEVPVSANNIFSQRNFFVEDPLNNPENFWIARRLPAMYARLVFEDDTASESLKNLCKAWILYGDAGSGYSYGSYLFS